MEKPTLENPFAFIERRFNYIEGLLIEIRNRREPSPAPDYEPPIDAGGASQFLGISKQTLYQNIDKIPHRKRFGRLYFFRSELLAYLNAGEGNPA